MPVASGAAVAKGAYFVRALDWAARLRWLVVVISAATAFAGPPGCLERRDDPAPVDGEPAACASCHGDAARAGDALQRAAPPIDMQGTSDPGYPGVGAHLEHVYGSETHSAVACDECHVVPATVDAPGHADDPAPAEVIFGALAELGGRAPQYDPVARQCSDSYCHGNGYAAWTAPRPSAAACGSCHGLPPPPPHPGSDRCAACHGAVIDDDRRITMPELHVDGDVQYAAAEACTGCHGEGDDPAPPLDLQGNRAITAIGVGGHQVHLLGGASSRPVECSECHVVPAGVNAPGHIDPLPAEVIFEGPAAAGNLSPSWDRTIATCKAVWCHGPDAGAPGWSPVWTSAVQLTCTGCHGFPPPTPHPQSDECGCCHSETVAEDGITVLARFKHVDGIVQLAAAGCAR